VPTTELSRFVRDVMLRHPKTMSAQTSVDEARAALTNDHVHMLLITEDRILLGTVVRSDLPWTTEGCGPVLPWSVLSGRTVTPEACACAVQELLTERGLRRVAVTDHNGALFGLMCLNRNLTGFCSEDDVASRARSHDLARTHPNLEHDQVARGSASLRGTSHDSTLT
jgi:CBS-domain-containing membrane protein